MGLKMGLRMNTIILCVFTENSNVQRESWQKVDIDRGTALKGGHLETFQV